MLNFIHVFRICKNIFMYQQNYQFNNISWRILLSRRNATCMMLPLFPCDLFFLVFLFASETSSDSPFPFRSFMFIDKGGKKNDNSSARSALQWSEAIHKACKLTKASVSLMTFLLLPSS